MMVITEEAMEAVSTTVWDPNNRQLTREFMSRWDAYEYQVGDNQKPLSKQERWALREVMTKPEIGAWRGTLDGTNRRKLNHPNKVIERWRRATQTSDKDPKKPSSSMSRALKERSEVIEQLEERNKELAEELEGARKGGTARQTIEELVAALAGMLKEVSPERQIEVLSDLAGQLGIATERQKVKQRRAKRGPFERAEDAVNAALGNLMKGN